MYSFDSATGQLNVGTYPLTPHHADFAPRVGFAYSPGDNWVVRGSYGVFWDRLPGNQWVWQNVGPPYSGTYSAVSNPSHPTISMVGLFPIVTPTLVGASLFDLANRSDPYDQQWTLSVQRRLPFSVLAEVAYVGIKGTHLSTRVDLNTSAYGGGPRPYPQYGYIAADEGIGSSRYNALELTVKKEFSHGLNFLSAYTYAQALGTAALDWGRFNATWTHLDFGLQDSTVRNRLSTSLGYALPFGNNLTGVARQAAAGWHVEGILSFQSGYPFGVGMTINRSNNNATFTSGNPNRVCNGNISNRTIQQWFNTSCFVLPAQNTFGDSAINPLTSPGTTNVDFSILKNFPLGAESRFLQFRAEFFNGFNNVNFGFPGATIGAPGYGVIASAYAARIIQLALKLAF